MSSLFLTIIVTFFAGMGAGLGTGFAGMSAAAVQKDVQENLSVKPDLL